MTEVFAAPIVGRAVAIIAMTKGASLGNRSSSHGSSGAGHREPVIGKRSFGCGVPEIVCGTEHPTTGPQVACKKACRSGVRKTARNKMRDA